MDISEYEYFDDSELPLLILGFYRQVAQPLPVELNPEAPWVKIAHQTAGLGCCQKYLDGIILPLRPEVQESVENLCQYFVCSEMGFLYSTPTMKEALEYREILNKTLGVDCDYAYTELQEGFYPVDCTENHIARLTPKKIIYTDLLLQPAPWVLPPWMLVILGRNGD